MTGDLPDCKEVDLEKRAAAIAATSAAMLATQIENPLLRNNPFKREDLPLYFPGFKFNAILNYTEIFKPPPEPPRTYKFLTEFPTTYRQSVDQVQLFLKYVPQYPIIINSCEPVSCNLPASPKPKVEISVEKDSGDTLYSYSDLKEVPELLKNEMPAVMPLSLLPWEDDIIYSDGDSKDDEPPPSPLEKLSASVPAASYPYWELNVQNGSAREKEVGREEVAASDASSVHSLSDAEDGVEEIPVKSTSEKRVNEASSVKSLFSSDFFLHELSGLDKMLMWTDDHTVLPTKLLLDLNDKSQLFEYGEGPFPTPTTESKDEEKGHSSLKRSHWLAVLQSLETQTTPTGLDLFNLSNDERSNTNGGTAQPAAKFTVSHSLPALRLSDAYFSTYYTANSLRHWHRMPLRGMESHRKYTVISLLRYIEKRARERETELQANGGGELLLMRSRKDLSGKDGQLVLFEFCEEFPCVLSNVGMASKLVNYYRKRGKEGRPKFEFGALTIVSKSDRPQYFLGELCEGQWLQSIENNLFRAPIYSHKPRITDFLLVKSKSRIYIREITHLFTVGQQLPKVEVPAPNNRSAAAFMRTRLNVYIHKLFMDKKNVGGTINTEEIKRAFPSYSESYIRKILKGVAEFKRGSENCWHLRPDYQLPTEDELREKLTPEDVCCYESMLAAQQRLKDAGYGSHSLSLSLADEEYEDALNMDEELQFAPWNTTKNFLDTKQNKCYIKVIGAGDPTGCGEGFSYFRVPIRPSFKSEKFGVSAKKRLTKDLALDSRKLTALGSGPPQESAWERREGEPASGPAKDPKTSLLENQRRFLDACNKVFHIQNQSLSSDKTLLSDSSDTDSDLDDFGNTLEDELAGDLKKIEKKQILKIHRTFRNYDGSTYKRTETIRDARVIELYIEKIAKRNEILRSLKEKEAALARKRLSATGKKAATASNSSDGKSKSQQVQKEKIFKCGACGMIGHMKTNKLCPNRSFSNAVVELPDEPLELKQKDRDVKVGGLGKHGRDELAKEENDTSPASVLKVEGLMLSIPADFVLESPKATEEELDNVASLEAALVAQKEKLQPLTSSKASKRKKNVSASSASAKKSQRTVQRRFSPIIEFQRYLETVWQKMRDVPDSWPFHYKVDARFVSDYYAIIKQPMDLSKIQENINKQEYFTREAFMKDIDLMVNNCILYNGPRHPLTDIAENLRCTCKSYFSQHDDELLRLEKLIEISFLQNAFNDKT